MLRKDHICIGITSNEQTWLQVLRQVLPETRISRVAIIPKLHLNSFLLKAIFYLLNNSLSPPQIVLNFLNYKYNGPERSCIKGQTNGRSSDSK